MGSTGSGSFSDYPGSRPKDGGKGGGGASGDDRCARAFSCALEEVEHCEYFSASGNVPPANTTVSIEQRGRLFAVDAGGLSVGALPIRLNYLADCMAAGFAYEGRVHASATGPVASISVDFAPRRP
jgi:hypothetical protein